jgi:uncharacterized protein DUF3800
MPVHAFVDESRRGSMYLIAAAVVTPPKLKLLRRDVRGLLLPGQRELHFNNEKVPRRRQLADAIARLPVEVLIYMCPCRNVAEPARQACMARLTADLLSRSAHRLVIDSREELDARDDQTIRRVIARHPHQHELTYEHLNSTSECLLWLADATAWCLGRRGVAEADQRTCQRCIRADWALNSASPARRPSGRPPGSLLWLSQPPRCSCHTASLVGWSEFGRILAGTGPCHWFG